MFGKTDLLVMPKPLPVKRGKIAQRVPLAVMGVTAAIADLLEQAAHGDQGIIQRPRQGGQHPTGAALKEFFQAISG